MRAAAKALLVTLAIASAFAIFGAALSQCPSSPHPLSSVYAAPEQSSKARGFTGNATRNVVSLLEHKLVQTTVMAAAPTLAGDGVAITSWRISGEFSGPYAWVSIYGSAPATITAPAAGGDGVEIYGYRLGMWWLIAELRDGRDTTISTTKGYAQAVNIIGIFERLAVVGTVSAGTATVKLAPIEAWD